MSDQTESASSPAAGQLAEADASYARLDEALATMGDGDLHRAHYDGGWTVAQTLSHMNMCVVAWLGNLARLEADPGLRFFFREEIGHDLLGYPPPTVDVARRQLAATRRTLATAFSAIGTDVLARQVEIPDLGTMSVKEWLPLIVGHASTHHVQQAFDILLNREVVTAEVAGDFAASSAEAGQ
ncbi:hypothetical protein GCM10011519_11310 [Marmoricola endophyticus]|uniref:DinB-like domain-containing protein n=1 Tax=Marmoricola endophyticus TaxID=2040280 RepID=A0A917BER5_9ACTN|nr:DinB family protein [Marmoricola endophyticus]GGF39435.1 hypothetical protein GCM10011519_11310 [Marmoricola endophyticus]